MRCIRTLAAVIFLTLTQQASAQFGACLPGFCVYPPPTSSLCSQFTIPSTTSLVAWIDACIASSFTLSSGAVQTAIDQSSHAYSFGAGSIGPQYVAAGFNARPTLAFSGSATLTSLNYPTAAFGTGNELTFFSVGTLDADSNGFHANGPLISYTASGATSAFNNVGSFGIINLGAAANITYDRNAVTLGTSVTYGAQIRVIFTLKSDGTRTLYINGSVAATSASIVANFVSPGYLSMGGSQFDTNFFNGNYAGLISEWGLYNVFKDATAVAALDTYLKNKWGM